jgi:hypothetical protein
MDLGGRNGGDVCSFDRDPDIYGIRALNSCRARHYNSVRQRQPRLLGSPWFADHVGETRTTYG